MDCAEDRNLILTIIRELIGEDCEVAIIWLVSYELWLSRYFYGLLIATGYILCEKIGEACNLRCIDSIVERLWRDSPTKA